MSSFLWEFARASLLALLEVEKEKVEIEQVEKEKVGKEKEDLAALLSDYIFCLQNAEKDLLKKQDMTTLLTSTLLFLPQSEPK